MLNKFIGSLIGGAAGDALGYAVEFENEKAIKKIYGENGITEYDLDPKGGVARISDDTQMTLFTANGLIAGYTRNRIANGHDDKNGFMSYISNAYQDWHTTQFNFLPNHNPKCAWIANIPELYEMRAPGGTCLKSCYKGANGTIEKPINDKYGCGGVMRVAPIGLMFNPDDGHTIEEIDMFGAAAALTHGSPLGYMPAAAMVHIVNRMVYTDMPLIDAVNESVEFIRKLFPDSPERVKLIALMNKAVELSNSDLSDLSCIHLLGEGWKADEALAISIYCALRHQDNFEEALIAAVNHRGDSDSTGSITGNILGARMSIQSIPKKFIDTLELKELIVEIATDLYNCTKMSTNTMIADDLWQRKYVDKTHKG